MPMLAGAGRGKVYQQKWSGKGPDHSRIFRENSPYAAITLAGVVTRIVEIALN